MHRHYIKQRMEYLHLSLEKLSSMSDPLKQAILSICALEKNRLDLLTNSDAFSTFFNGFFSQQSHGKIKLTIEMFLGIHIRLEPIISSFKFNVALLKDRDVFDLIFIYYSALCYAKKGDTAAEKILNYIVESVVIRRLMIMSSANQVLRFSTDANDINPKGLTTELTTEESIHYFDSKKYIEKLYSIIKYFFLNMEVRLSALEGMIKIAAEQSIKDSAIQFNADVISIFNRGITTNSRLKLSFDFPRKLQFDFTTYTHFFDTFSMKNNQDRNNIAFKRILLSALARQVMVNVSQFPWYTISHLSFVLAVNALCLTCENINSTSLKDLKKITTSEPNVIIQQSAFIQIYNLILKEKLTINSGSPFDSNFIISKLTLINRVLINYYAGNKKQLLISIFLICRISSQCLTFSFNLLSWKKAHPAEMTLLTSLLEKADLDQKNFFSDEYPKIVRDFELCDDLESQLFFMKAYFEYESEHHRVISNDFLEAWHSVLFEYIKKNPNEPLYMIIGAVDFRDAMSSTSNDLQWLMRSEILNFLNLMLYQARCFHDSQKTIVSVYVLSIFRKNPLSFYGTLFESGCRQAGTSPKNILLVFISCLHQTFIDYFMNKSQKEEMKFKELIGSIRENLGSYIDDAKLTESDKKDLLSQLLPVCNEKTSDIFSSLLNMFMPTLSDDQLELEFAKPCKKKKSKRKKKNKSITVLSPGGVLGSPVDLTSYSLVLNERYNPMPDNHPVFERFQFSEYLPFLLRMINAYYQRWFDETRGILLFNQFDTPINKFLVWQRLAFQALRHNFMLWKGVVSSIFDEEGYSAFNFGIGDIDMHFGLQMNLARIRKTFGLIASYESKVKGISKCAHYPDVFFQVRCRSELDLLPLELTFTNLRGVGDQPRPVAWIYPLDLLSQPITFFIESNRLHFHLDSLKLYQGAPAIINDYWNDIIQNLPPSFYKKIERLVKTQILENHVFMKFLNACSLFLLPSVKDSSVSISLKGSAIYGLLLAFQKDASIPPDMLFARNSANTDRVAKHITRYEKYLKFIGKCSTLRPTAPDFKPGNVSFGLG